MCFLRQNIDWQIIAGQDVFGKQLTITDKQITQKLLQAEKKCIKRKRQTEWSAELHQTSKMCKYWVKLYKGMRNVVHTESSVAKPKAELQKKCGSKSKSNNNQIGKM